MTTYFLRRLLRTLPVLWVVSTVVFGMVHMIPGDPIDFQIGEQAELDQKQELRWQYQLDRPVLLNRRPWVSNEELRERLAAAGPLVGGSARQSMEAESLEDMGVYAVTGLVEVLNDRTAPDDLRRLAGQRLPTLARRPVPALPLFPDLGGEARETWNGTLEEAVPQMDAHAANLRDDAPGAVEQASIWWTRWTAGHADVLLPGRGEVFAIALLDTQYARFFPSLLNGTARSLHTGRGVFETLAEKLPATLQLALTSLLVAALISVPLGLIAAVNRNSWIDSGSMLAALVGISMPNFWLGPLLILYFAVHLGWLPVSGSRAPGALILPAITLGFGMSAILTRMTRASMLDVLTQDYIRTAHAKGLRRWKVLWKHALRNALLPVVTIMGLQFGALLAGSIITEEIFAWPGVGREVIGAIRSRDFPMIQGCVLLIACSYVLVNLLTDLLYMLVNPKVQLD